MSKRFTTEIKVLWSEVDIAGILYFGHFFRFFETAEAEFFDHLAGDYLNLMNTLNLRLLRAAAHCDFRSPARYRDRLNVSIRIGRIGRTSLTYHFDVERPVDGEHLADGYLVVVAVSVDDYRPVPLSPRLIELIKPYYDPDLSQVYGESSGS